MSWALNPWTERLVGGLTGYLVGAIPFGYLVYYWARGVDIRTVGSGNIGATNVGRNLGFRYFVLVFILDVLKGLVPTLGVPIAMKRLGIEPPTDLPVGIALASILGHNFPLYLNFQGGKGVATSLGALLALDPVACGVAAVAFFLVFFLTRYVSLSSIAGALAFAAGYFVRAEQPWSKENLAMSLLSVAIPFLLVIRHHKNLSRILAGTEPKVRLKRSGRIHPALLIALTVVAALLSGFAFQAYRTLNAPIEITAGPWALRETHREQTGQQRSTRVVFADHGRLLAVMCPRYNKVLLYDVTSQAHLQPASEIALDGRPVALASVKDRLLVLQRPAGDDKHLGPGWWESFGLDGQATGPRVPAGYYPDDMLLTPDGLHLVVLNSGRAEGDKKKPLPGIDVFRFDGKADMASWQSISHLDMEQDDDGDRLYVSASGSRLLVTLSRSKRAVAIDLADPERPRVAGWTELGQSSAPYVSFSPDGDWMIMPTGLQCEAVAVQDALTATNNRTAPSAANYLIYTRPEDSAVELAQANPVFALGRFPLKGPLNLGGTRPTGLAYSHERGLLAVTTKPGTVHLIVIQARHETEDWPLKGRVATNDDRARRKW